MKTLINKEIFTPFKIRKLEFKNRLFMSPMCQYSAVDGIANSWHFQHYLTRAVGGAALIMVEATAVNPEGRISPSDLGLWNNDQKNSLAKIADDVHSAGSRIGIQLNHAGRKASVYVEWQGTGVIPEDAGGWQTVSPSAAAFDENYGLPHELSVSEIQGIIDNFAAAARRAVEAGFDAVEIHAAHGYLAHQFLSPLSNKRTDWYGVTFEGRIRFVCEVTAAVRNVLPPDMPLFIRISATDWVEGGWTAEESAALVAILKDKGVDAADVSSGGLIPNVKITIGPGYQVPLAEKIRHETGIITGTVGLITTLEQAEEIIASEKADFISLGRLLLRDPYFPLRNTPREIRNAPVQYKRGF